MQHDCDGTGGWTGGDTCLAAFFIAHVGGEKRE
jgi:hypothetical protein